MGGTGQLSGGAGQAAKHQRVCPSAGGGTALTGVHRIGQRTPCPMHRHKNLERRYFGTLKKWSPNRLSGAHLMQQCSTPDSATERSTRQLSGATHVATPTSQTSTLQALLTLTYFHKHI